MRVWNIAGTGQKKVLSGHDDAVNSIAISLDGHTLLSGGKDDVLKLWDLDGGKELLTFVGHTNDVNSVAIFQDRDDPARLSAAISGSSDETMKVWRVGRADRYIEFSRSLPGAQSTLTGNPADRRRSPRLGAGTPSGAFGPGRWNCWKRPIGRGDCFTIDIV